MSRKILGCPYLLTNIPFQPQMMKFAFLLNLTVVKSTEILSGIVTSGINVLVPLS